ncbi:hypothetical protein HDU97_001852 [Phlyctochytrium planicorne]|nr:hypothetical protein HDU97_001852 [Phlyctochytrium planicorne]
MVRLNALIMGNWTRSNGGLCLDLDPSFPTEHLQAEVSKRLKVPEECISLFKMKSQGRPAEPASGPPEAPIRGSSLLHNLVAGAVRPRSGREGQMAGFEEVGQGRASLDGSLRRVGAAATPWTNSGLILEDLLKTHSSSPASSKPKIPKELLEPIDRSAPGLPKTIGELFDSTGPSSPGVGRSHMEGELLQLAIVVWDPLTPTVSRSGSHEKDLEGNAAKGAHKSLSTPVSPTHEYRQCQLAVQGVVEAIPRHSFTSGETTLPRANRQLVESPYRYQRSSMESGPVEPIPPADGDVDGNSQYHPARDSMQSYPQYDPAQSQPVSPLREGETWFVPSNGDPYNPHISVSSFQMPSGWGQRYPANQRREEIIPPPIVYIPGPNPDYGMFHHQGYIPNFPPSPPTNSGQLYYNQPIYHPENQSYPFQLPNPYPHILDRPYPPSSASPPTSRTENTTMQVEVRQLSDDTILNLPSQGDLSVPTLPPLTNDEKKKERARKRASMTPTLFKLRGSMDKQEGDVERRRKCPRSCTLWNAAVVFGAMLFVGSVVAGIVIGLHNRNAASDQQNSSGNSDGGGVIVVNGTSTWYSSATRGGKSRTAMSTTKWTSASVSPSWPPSPSLSSSSAGVSSSASHSISAITFPTSKVSARRSLKRRDEILEQEQQILNDTQLATRRIKEHVPTELYIWLTDGRTGECATADRQTGDVVFTPACPGSLFTQYISKANYEQQEPEVVTERQGLMVLWQPGPVEIRLKEPWLDEYERKIVTDMCLRVNVNKTVLVDEQCPEKDVSSQFVIDVQGNIRTGAGLCVVVGPDGLAVAREKLSGLEMSLTLAAPSITTTLSTATALPTARTTYFFVRSEQFKGCMSADPVTGRLTFGRACPGQIFFSQPVSNVTAYFETSVLSYPETTSTVLDGSVNAEATTIAEPEPQQVPRGMETVFNVANLLKGPEVGVWFESNSLRGGYGDCISIKKGNVIILQKGCAYAQASKPIVDPAIPLIVPTNPAKPTGDTWDGEDSADAGDGPDPSVPNELSVFAHLPDGTIRNAGGFCIQAMAQNLRTYAMAV